MFRGLLFSFWCPRSLEGYRRGGESHQVGPSFSPFTGALSGRQRYRGSYHKPAAAARLGGGQQWLIEHAAAQCTVWRFFFRAANKTTLRAAGQASTGCLA